jgi:mercuric ion transport protein
MDLQAAPVTPAAPASRERLGLRLAALAVLSTILASTCCVLPLVLVLLGVGGAWIANLAALKPATPLFVAIALGTIGWAGYIVFRPAAVCEDGVCAVARPATRRIFIGCALFVALLLGFPLIAPLFY